jgi:hypothetical protein
MGKYFQAAKPAYTNEQPDVRPRQQRSKWLDHRSPTPSKRKQRSHTFRGEYQGLSFRAQTHRPAVDLAVESAGHCQFGSWPDSPVRIFTIPFKTHSARSA